MKGIVLTAGIGTRLQPITYFLNKNLLPVDGQPMFFHPLQTLIDSGIKEIAIVIGPPHGNQIKKTLENSPFPKKINIVYINQPQPKGMADAIGRCKKFALNNNIIVIAGDNIYGSNFKDDVAKFKTGALSFLRKVSDPQRFGVPVYESKNKLIKIEEKPTHPATNWVVTGPHLYDNKVFDLISQLKLSARGELEISELNSLYIQKNALLLIKRVDFWIDAGTFESLIQANNYFLKRRGELKK